MVDKLTDVIMQIFNASLPAERRLQIMNDLADAYRHSASVEDQESAIQAALEAIR